MTVRFKNVLVPVDLSNADAPTFDLVLELTGGSDATVTLLHVIEAIDGEPDEEMQVFYASLEAKARLTLGELSRKLAEKGLAVEQEIVFGQRVGQIVRHSVEHGVDLVVMRCEKVDLANPGDEWRSLSHQVSILSQCPVLLLK